MKHTVSNFSNEKCVIWIHQFLVLSFLENSTKITGKQMPIQSRIILSYTDAVQGNTNVHIITLLLALTHPLILNRSLQKQQEDFLFLLQWGKKKDKTWILFVSANSWTICHFTVPEIFCNLYKYSPSALYKS